eukprot:jgi/Ulvmu1/172/UM001_0176.1
MTSHSSVPCRQHRSLCAMGSNIFVMAWWGLATGATCSGNPACCNDSAGGFARICCCSGHGTVATWFASTGVLDQQQAEMHSHFLHHSESVFFMCHREQFYTCEQL